MKERGGAIPDWPCSNCRGVERNARLVIALRRLASDYHARLHKGGTMSWQRCPLEPCCDVKKVIEEA